ncbi:MAG: hypothetical protein HPY85_14805 [Anaerolineae bacterium]|nr:hypothetical protein [Anaerolineae bacterium]
MFVATRLSSDYFLFFRFSFRSNATLAIKKYCVVYISFAPSVFLDLQEQRFPKIKPSDVLSFAAAQKRLLRSICIVWCTFRFLHSAGLKLRGKVRASAGPLVLLVLFLFKCLGGDQQVLRGIHFVFSIPKPNLLRGLLFSVLFCLALKGGLGNQ